MNFKADRSFIGYDLIFSAKEVVKENVYTLSLFYREIKIGPLGWSLVKVLRK